MQKAMELNGKKVMGQELKLDMPRSKETAQEDKKGKDLCLMREKFKKKRAKPSISWHARVVRYSGV